MKSDKVTLGTKIYVSQGLTVGFLLLLGITTAISIAKLGDQVHESVTLQPRKIEVINRIGMSVESAQSAQRGVMLGAMTGDTRQLEASRQILLSSSADLQAATNELGPMLQSDGARRIHSSLKQDVAQWMQQIPHFDNHVRAQRFDEATKMQSTVFAPLLDKMQREAADMMQVQRSILARIASSSVSNVSLSRWLTILLCLLAATVAVAAFWVIRKANSSLRRIAGEIAEGSRQVASASHQVSSSSQALAQGSSEQAASLEETSASTEEVNSMTQKNAENARTAAAETEKADQLLKETNQKLSQMIESMKEINTSSEKISRIIRVIDEIAFQTNILALNAAVEAARAGEAGMGFAVVADEVRNLAQRCAQAAKDTSDLIEESIVRSNEGKVRLDEVAACVGRVVKNASAIKVLSNEVHVGSQEQARGIEQIAKAIAQMQQVTQSTAASAEESASAGEEMSAQAASLQDSVQRLRGLIGGSQEEPVRRSPAAFSQSAGRTAAARSLAMSSSPRTSRTDIPLDDDFQNF